MNVYEIKEINWNKIKTLKEFEEANEKATTKYIEGLEAVKEYIGANLKRQRAGYTAWKNSVEYIVVRVK